MEYYFENKEGEVCYSLESIKDRMRDDNIKERTVFIAIPQSVDGFFWCKEYGEVTESHVSCGKICDYYKPRNGINGRCKHHTHFHEATYKTKLVKIK